MFVPGCLATQPDPPEPTAPQPAPVEPRPADTSPPFAPGLIEYPSLSPDGSTLVFSWAGDLWAVGRSGGHATRLTAHPADETRSAFSPDGSMLAFESDRNGARNLYVVPLTLTNGAVAAGPVRRVTNADAAQLLAGWSPDGTELYYSARQEPEIYRHVRMWRAPLDGGPCTRLTDAFGRLARSSPDGSKIVFTRGFWIFERPAYRGSGDLDLFMYTPADGSFEQITEFDGNDGDGFLTPDGSVVFISSRDGQNNLWRLAPGKTDEDRRALTQLTHFAPGDEATIGHGVLDLGVSRDGSTAAFTVWDTLYALDLTRAGADPETVEVYCSADTDSLDTRHEDLSHQASEAALSPDGDTMAVIARGEVFVRSVDEGRPTRRVTRTAGREEDLAWSPDGRHLYFSSDEPGTPAIRRASVTLSREDIEPDDNTKADEDETDDATQEDGASKGDGGADDAAPAAAPPDDGVSGTWSCTAVSSAPDAPPDGIPFTLEVRLDGDSFSGTLSVPLMYDGPISGSWEAASRTLSFIVSVDDGEGSVTLEIGEGELTGSARAGEVTFTITGERVAGLPAPETETSAEADKPKKEKDEESKIDYGERWAGALRFDVETFVEDAAGASRPMPSPDGLKLLYVRGLGDLVLVDLKTGERRVVYEHWDEPELVWASDSRHVVYAVQDEDFNSDIWLRDVLDPDAEPVNLTRHPDSDTSPRLSHDGKVLYFRSDRAGDNWDYDVWAVDLDKELEGMRPYELDDYFKDAAKAAKKLKPIDPVESEEPDGDAAEPEPAEPAADGAQAAGENAAAADEGEAGADDEAADKEEEDEALEPLEFDAADAYLRVRRLTSHPGSEGDLMITPGGDRVLYSASLDGGNSLYSVDYKGAERKTVQSGSVSNVTMSLTGDKAVMVRSGQAMTVPPAGGKAETVAIDANITIDVAAEQRVKFDEAARILGTSFYHPTLKGLDWAALTERYRSLAVRARTSGSFNRVVQRLFGELEGSHTGISGGGGYSASEPGHGCLGVEAEPVAGGYRVTRVITGSPADRDASRLDVGDVIVEVGETVLADEGETPRVDLHAALEGTVGEETLIRVVRVDPEKPEYVIITPISGGAESNLRYEQEVLDRRARVEELSDGRLGYLHIRGMGASNVRDFERDLYAAAHGKDGLIIDVRDNGGGWTTDILLSSLTAPAHAFTVPRGADFNTMPRDAYPRDRRLIYGYARPISVLINENSFSNAEIFAHAIKTIGRGRLVGTRTFGGVISTGAARLIDGTTVRVPFRGWFLPDGADMESNGAVPDVPVEIGPPDEAAGRDPQLDAAARELLERAGG